MPRIHEILIIIGLAIHSQSTVAVLGTFLEIAAAEKKGVSQGVNNNNVEWTSPEQ